MENLRVVGIPHNIVWHDAIENRKILEAIFKKLPETDLIILPEMFTTGFTREPEAVAEARDGATPAWLQSWAEKLNCSICGSIATKEKGHYFNRFYGVNQNSVFIYDKKHLFRYAKENEHYTAGNMGSDWIVKGWRIRPIICYDLRFPVWCRNTKPGNNPYDVLLCVANWPQARQTAWESLLKARAIENMAYCIGVNRIGEDNYGIEYPTDSSLVFDTLGANVSRTNENDFFACEISKEHISSNRTRFGFLNDAHSLV